MPLNRDDEQGLIFGADEIARLVKECHRGPATTFVDSDGEDEEDDTLLQYCSDDEGGNTTVVDSDDEYLLPII